MSIFHKKPLRERGRRAPSMKRKFIFGMSSIAAILLLSSIISVLEYRRMSNYVSDLIASNINSLNLSQRLATITDNYNLQILALIGDETTNILPKLDRELFLDHCDSLKQSLKLPGALPLADSVAYAYSAYMLTSLELQNVISSDFIDSRQWYFERLQPRFNILRQHLEKLNEAIYRDLEYNSETFQESFYRSIVPGVVSVAAGLMLVLLLLYFFLSYFVNPVSKISEGIFAYLSGGKRFSYTDSEGDDEVSDLGRSVEELTEENIDLKRRIKLLKSRLEDQK
ncbi:MAG: hypothetical protein ACI39U_02390 [Candidatus Cryptobacteroides sp.]